MWKGVLSYKLQKKYGGDDFILKNELFQWEIGHCLRFCTAKIACSYYA